jgi:hypothetical protein
MPRRRGKEELALVNPEVPHMRVTIAGLIAKLFSHGPARADEEIFAYVDAHFDWSTVASIEEMINQAKWAYIDAALHATTSLTVRTQDGQTKKKQVRKYLKPTEYDPDGNAAKRWKLASHCTPKQLKECGATYVKQTLDIAEATNAFGIYAKQIVKHQMAIQQAGQLALPSPSLRSKKPKKILTPREQAFFTEIMEVATVNPDTGERHLRVKAEEIKINESML